MTKNASPHVTAYLCANGAADAIEFYKKAFGAIERSRMQGDDGHIGHAEITIGETTIMLADEFPQMNVYSPLTLKGSSVSFVIDGPDCDAAFQRAIDAGATVERPMRDEPYGRSGWLIDPFGHRWSIMTSNPDFDPASPGTA